MAGKKKRRNGPAPLGLGETFSVRLMKEQERWLRREARRRGMGLAAALRAVIFESGLAEDAGV